MANYPKEFDDLLQEYLTDGIITAQERKVLLRKAEKLGLDVDEIDLYITAQEQKVEQAADAAVRKQKGQTCPYCGGSVPQLSDQCPHCGQHITPEASKELIEIIENLEEALVDLKDSKNFERSKAQVERYSRKARMYYSNNPKVKPLLEEVNAEMEIAEKKYLAQHTWFKEHPAMTTFLAVLLVLIIVSLIWGFCTNFDGDSGWWCPIIASWLPGVIIYAHYNNDEDKKK
ncbi:MAG: hypothetical protein K2K98_13070 [Muribaculaceae bacterium]|nr:hypothetical protein [Muribaculaceae bacterium]